MNTFKNFLLGILFAIMFTTIVRAQHDHLTCGLDDQIPEGELQAVIGGKYKPSANAPGEYLRVLFVFAQFASDNNIVPGWQKDSLPDWAYSIVDNVPSSNYSQYSISEYFNNMSNGDFDIIGDIHPNIITVPSNMSWVNANINVISQLNTQISDFTRYDNWYYQDGAFFFRESGGDGYLDMMHIIYRWAYKDWFIPEGGNWGGIARLGFTIDIITHDGIKISGKQTHVEGSGITTNMKGSSTNSFALTKHFAHEYGHYLFGGIGGYHTYVSGIMPYDANGETYAMSAWERERLGYISIQSAYNGQYKTLKDYLTYNDALRIPISTGEYFIIENHQRINYYDQVIRGGALGGALDPNAQEGKGVYVWYIKGGENFPPQTYAITADGSWNWIFDRWETMYGWDDPPPVVAVLDRGTSYRYLPNQLTGENGKGDRNPRLRVYVNNVFQHQARWHDIDPFTKGWIISRDVMGDETDAFNIGYNEIFTPWSNPGSTKFINDVEVPTNISFKLHYINGEDIGITVYTTSSGALSLPPSKPQKFQVTSQYYGYESLLTWEANKEPDMISGGKYKIYRSENSENNFYLIATINAYVNGQPVTSFVDDEIGPSRFSKLYYRIVAFDNTNKESVPSDFDWRYGRVPKESFSDYEFANIYQLFSNYPNPFNPSTLIQYSVKENGWVNLKVYDILGSEVAVLVNSAKEPGNYEVNFDASDLPSGVYIYTLQVNGFTDSKKMLLLR